MKFDTFKLARGVSYDDYGSESMGGGMPGRPETPHSRDQFIYRHSLETFTHPD